MEAKYLVTDGERPTLRRWTRPAAPIHDKETSTIVDRDVFCSRCPTLIAKRAEEKKQLAAPSGPHRSSLPLSLGAVVVTRDQASSIAVLRDTSKPRPQPAEWFHCGDSTFATGAILQRIEERRVYLRNGEQVEFLDLDEPVATKGPTAKSPPTSTHRDALSAEIDQGVRCNGGACQVQRSLVNELLANTSLLASSARFVPAMQGGHPNGFRVYAIHPGSLFDKLGIQNGDRVVSINGMSLATPDQALGIYSKLRNASHLSMELERHGSLTTLDYMIL